MSSNESNQRVYGVGTFVFALVAVMLSFGALFVAAEAYSRSDDAKQAVRTLKTEGVVPSATKVTLEEFTMVPHPGVVKAGKVTLEADNVGSVTHELVLVRAPGVDALPRVTTATKERAVGDVDEEAIPEADKMGETGDIAPQKHVTKTFDLAPGTYVMFCNIDTPSSNGVTNHFQHGMSAVLIAQ